MKYWTSLLILYTLVTLLHLKKQEQPDDHIIHSINNYRNKSLIRYIYLTFDDGPLKGSKNIDSISRAEQIKVNVFVVGENIEHNKILRHYYSLYKENPFVQIYNHSYTHAGGKYRRFYDHPENVLKDIQRNEQLLNIEYKIVRLPGRNIWRVGERRKNDETNGSTSADLLEQNGYKIFGWDVEWIPASKNDTAPQSIDEIEKEIGNKLMTGKTFTPNHIVILLHDEMFKARSEERELKQLIDWINKQENISFEHLSFYPVQ